ncbi:2-dehydro-3-deoxygluconokinase [Virgibacillus natechei]|uniref:2-dehydro-3-deoxygluconokinase n=1 Tax=Virgibacillus natechei TaxID=1216297 RepID=A0ABS4IEP5_9BACI|nr:sugar kinase [Virgibacillus natechei]MBP1969323.1 2-dehydro-3-deoxygluconokinase [Virgibacillus natechei]UZD12475.1 sugar kinase [Virgibacillus natechei]
MDLITIGESMVLFTPHTSGPLRFTNTFHKTIGGAESNVAIALSRLGHQTGWISHLGDDEFGLYVRNYIRGEGVDTSAVRFDKHFPTSVFFKEINPGQDPKIYYYRKGSAASQMTPENVDENYLSKAKFIHLTGITPAISESCRRTIYKVIDIAKENKQTVVFDPNIRLKLWSKEEATVVLGDIARRCDIVLPGLEEGTLLTGEKSTGEIASSLLQGDTKVVVVKRGEAGAYFATKDDSAYITGEKVSKVMDTAGAGDGFAAGFLSGLIRGRGYREAVELGNQVGAHALTVTGDVEGYPYWSQIAPDTKEILR